MEGIHASHMGRRELDLIANKLLSMGRTCFAVNEWYRYRWQSGTIYEVSSYAPLEFCDVMYFLATEAERYHGPIYDLQSETAAATLAMRVGW